MTTPSKLPGWVVYAELDSRGFVLTVDAGKLVVVPASNLTPDDRESIRNHRDDLVTIVDSIPSACFARGVCPVLGICGRVRCLVGTEREAFASEIEASRSIDNPHRIPNEFMSHDISKEGAA